MWGFSGCFRLLKNICLMTLCFSFISLLRCFLHLCLNSFSLSFNLLIALIFLFSPSTHLTCHLSLSLVSSLYFSLWLLCFAFRLLTFSSSQLFNPPSSSSLFPFFAPSPLFCSSVSTCITTCRLSLLLQLRA